MLYRSTRSDQTVTAPEAILSGIAKDGGLYLPCTMTFDAFDWEKTVQKDFYGIAEDVLGAMFDDFDKATIADLVRRAYVGKFETEDVTPTVFVEDFALLELFRGPTSAFKDVALSLLPHLLVESKKRLGVTDEIVILTATSGDTGKAALQGFMDVAGTKIVVFYPHGGVSAVQRAQMVTQGGDNTFVAAIRGNFDDAQTGVKNLFSSLRDSAELKDAGARLSSANSINIGRLAPQIVYYFKAYGDLVRAGKARLGDAVDFVVPTGNFGNILAGYFARRMGLPVGKLVCASNKNNVLYDFIRTGTYDRRRPFYLTNSPSMDILVSSNLERLLFLLSEDESFVSSCMQNLFDKGTYQVPETVQNRIREVFAGYFCDDDAAAETLGDVYRKTGVVIDPHTAVGFSAARQYRKDCGSDRPTVVLSTASPYKFSRPVLKAIGQSADGEEFDLLKQLSEVTGTPIPPNLAALKTMPERHLSVIDKEEMGDFVRRALS